MFLPSTKCYTSMKTRSVSRVVSRAIAIALVAPRISSISDFGSAIPQSSQLSQYQIVRQNQMILPAYYIHTVTLPCAIIFSPICLCHALLRSTTCHMKKRTEVILFALKCVHALKTANLCSRCETAVSSKLVDYQVCPLPM